MGPRQLTIVDGMSERPDGQPFDRFASFARPIIDGGTIGDDDCTIAKPRRRYVVKDVTRLVYWIEAVEPGRASGEWVIGFFLFRRSADRVAAELNVARRAGIEDALS